MRSRIHLCLGKPRDSEGKNQAMTSGHLTWRGAAARAAASMPNFRFYGCVKARGRGWGRGGGSWAESGLWELASRFSSPQISRIIDAQGFGVRGMKYPNFGGRKRSPPLSRVAKSSSFGASASAQTQPDGSTVGKRKR